MAQKIQTLFMFIDDIDGSEAEGTVRFALDGADYEIDLNAKHAEGLREALGPYAAAGRKVGPAVHGPGRRGRAPGNRNKPKAPGDTAPKATFVSPAGGGGYPMDPASIRTWAAANGIEVKRQGRIPAPVTEKYVNAMEGEQQAKTTAAARELMSEARKKKPAAVPATA